METKQENVIRTDYSEIMQKSYIDYAMSVIISRALPDVRDGLNWESAMTVRIVNVHVLSVIPWVNIIHMVTVPFMTHLLLWHRISKKAEHL